MNGVARRFCTLLVLATAWGGCTSVSADRPAPVEPVLGASEGEGGSTSQSLFRVRYEGGEGGGGLRVVLRLESPQRFQLTTSDTLGRALWSAEVVASRTLLVDHRQQVYCEGEEEVRLEEPALQVFTLPVVVRLLQGQVPPEIDGEVLEEGSNEVVDSAGRRWSVRVDHGVVSAWTLFADERPLIWWTRAEKGGILSHRDGSQFRWRQVVSEPLAEALRPLPIPAAFQRLECHEYDVPQFRQDQSAPGGEGPS